MDELTSIVTSTLEARGVLNKIRAELHKWMASRVVAPRAMRINRKLDGAPKDQPTLQRVVLNGGDISGGGSGYQLVHAERSTSPTQGGDAAAQEDLSKWLIYGQGTPVDLKAAFEWAKKSAAAGNGKGQLHLGMLYRKGTGTEPDEKASNHWFAKAAQSLPAQVAKKDADAMLGLALLYFRGWGGLEQDRVKALALNRQAAEVGNPFGMVEVGDQLWDAKGTHRQRAKAKRLFQKALPLLMTLGEAGDRDHGGQVDGGVVADDAAEHHGSGDHHRGGVTVEPGQLAQPDGSGGPGNVDHLHVVDDPVAAQGLL